MNCMKKRLTEVLAAALLLSSFTACGDTASETTAADTTAAETEKETTALEARIAIPDDLPDKDYGGASFVSLCASGQEDALVIEELDGEIVNDETYNMNLRVEERFM